MPQRPIPKAPQSAPAVTLAAAQILPIALQIAEELPLLLTAAGSLLIQLGRGPDLMWRGVVSDSPVEHRLAYTIHIGKNRDRDSTLYAYRIQISARQGATPVAGEQLVRMVQQTPNIGRHLHGKPKQIGHAVVYKAQ